MAAFSHIYSENQEPMAELNKNAKLGQKSVVVKEISKKKKINNLHQGSSKNGLKAPGE